MSYNGLSEEICAAAWSIVAESMAQAHYQNTINKLAGTIVVLNPWTGDVLFASDLDDEHEQHDMFNDNAHAKALVSWETGMSSREVQQSAPHLYKPTMTKWGGSVVEHKLVVAFSGVQAVYDEAISWSVLAWIIAMCRNEMTKTDGVMNSDSSYI